MKVLAFVGSSRKDGNTSKIIEAICAGLKENGNGAEVYQLSELDNKGCKACDSCQTNKVEYCAINDKVTDLLPKIADADCIILGWVVESLALSLTIFYCQKMLSYHSRNICKIYSIICRNVYLKLCSDKQPYTRKRF